MKASDLMVGDFIVYTEFGKNDIDKIETLEPRRVWLEHGKTYVPIEFIEPIPLTTEILEKTGFDVSDKEIARYNFEENGEKLHFSLRAMYDRNGFQKGWSFFAFNVLTILDYIHELQHALHLCGIKKEIVL